MGCGASSISDVVDEIAGIQVLDVKGGWVRGTLAAADGVEIRIVGRVSLLYTTKTEHQEEVRNYSTSSTTDMTTTYYTKLHRQCEDNHIFWASDAAALAGGSFEVPVPAGLPAPFAASAKGTGWCSGGVEHKCKGQGRIDYWLEAGPADAPIARALVQLPHEPPLTLPSRTLPKVQRRVHEESGLELCWGGASRDELVKKGGNPLSNAAWSIRSTPKSYEPFKVPHLEAWPLRVVDWWASNVGEVTFTPVWEPMTSQLGRPCACASLPCGRSVITPGDIVRFQLVGRARKAGRRIEAWQAVSSRRISRRNTA